MELETSATLDLRGDDGPAFPVRVIATDEPRLTIISGGEKLGDWNATDIGIVALNRGFAVRAEGEEFLLLTENDPGVADILGLATASPRLARKVAASHPPEEREPEPEPPPVRSYIGAIAFSLAGMLVWIGGFALRGVLTGAAPSGGGDFPFWLVFVLGGLAMVGLGWVLSLGRPWGRVAAIVVVLVLAVFFAMAASTFDVEVGQLFAFGAVAGGLVVAVAVLFSGSLPGRSEQ